MAPSSSRRDPCCPWISTRRAPISPSAAAVVSWPPIRAEPRPSAAIERARITSPSSAHSSAPSGASNRACTFGGARALANEVRAAARADRERDAGGDHRLAGAGLAREDGEPGGGLDVELVDHAQTGDVQLPEHARILVGRLRHDLAGLSPRRSAGSPGRSNLSRTRARNGGGVGPPHEPRRLHRRAGSAPPRRPAARSSRDRPRTGVPARRPRPRASPPARAPSTNDRSNTMCGATAVTTSTSTDGDDDRPARGERVRGRAGRRRDDHAVGGERRQVLAVDLDAQPHEAVPGALLDHDLVHAPTAVERRAVHRLRDDGEPLLDGRVARERSRDQPRGVAVGAGPGSR